MSADSRPSSWLLFNEDRLPRAGYALDVACGRGRHARYLAQRGLDVVAVDRDPPNPDFLLCHGELAERLRRSPPGKTDPTRLSGTFALK